jgi:hypothetical protein
MPLTRISAATGFLLLAIAGAAACDDFDEEMAVQAARNAAKLAQATSAASPSEPSEPAELASVEPPLPSATTVATLQQQ